MATTYTLISSVTVGSGGTGTIEFSSIPATYTDLVVNLSGRCDADDFNVYLRFNSSTSNYTQRRLQGTGSAAESATDTNILMLSTRSSYTATTFSNGAAYIPNYAGSNFKSFSGDTVTENNAASGNNLYLNAALWSNTAAITSITLTPSSGDVAEYSTFYLYGIKKN